MTRRAFVANGWSVLICVGVGLGLAGCIVIPVPRTFVSAPKISGQLADAQTHAAVAGATVFFEGRTDSQVTTDAEGRFELRRQHDLVLFGIATPCPVYKFPEPRAFPGAIVVQAARYGSVTIPLRPYYDKTRFDSKDLKVEMGTVELTAATDVPPAGR